MTVALPLKGIKKTKSKRALELLSFYFTEECCVVVNSFAEFNRYFLIIF